MKRKHQRQEIEAYVSRRYQIALTQDDEGDWVARIVEFAGCVAHGASQSEALSRLAEVQRLWIEEQLRAGGRIPAPEQEAPLPSGKWVQRVPRSLHRELVETAKREGVSLNQLVTSMLSQAAVKRPAAD